MKPAVEVLKMVSTPILADSSIGIFGEEEATEAYSRTLNTFLLLED